MSYVKCLCWSLGHAEQLLFSGLCSKVTVYSQKLQCFFYIIHLILWVRVHRACSQLKITIAIYKQWLLTIDMKTKVVQNVPRINICIWHMTCDMRNVTCDMQNVTCNMWRNYKYSLLSLHMKISSGTISIKRQLESSLTIVFFKHSSI